MSRRSVLVRCALAAAVLALAVPAQSASAASSSSGSTAVALTTAQQRGLASLQKEIDATVARTGGHRTAVDEVSSADGNIVLTLPLPKGTEFLAGAPVASLHGTTATRPAAKAAAAGTGFRYGCPYSTSSWTGRWLCLYQYGLFNGNDIGDTGSGSGRMLRYHDAGYHDLAAYDFRNRASSMVNTTLSGWTLYAQRTEHAGCGAGDVHAQEVGQPKAGVPGGYHADGDLGAAADKTDCLVRS